MKIIECVPNISEGRNEQTIQKIADAAGNTEGVKLLDVDPGKATNRTVITFVGTPEAVIEGAFNLIKKAAELIDMRTHSGEHPRMGATDVCPMIPIAGITMEEAAEYAKILAKRVGEELNIPTFLYEAAASKPERKNLAVIRSGEYEGLEAKLKDPNWAPDFGKAKFNAQSGATVIGARDFLVAYNVNLNTTSVRRANAVAFDVREKGRVKRKGNKMSGEILRDESGEPLRKNGACKGVKAIGWFIEEYGVAQVSMNITNLKDTPLHEAFEQSEIAAVKRGMRVSGSELVGLVPLHVMLDAGRYFLKKQKRSIGVSDTELIKIAVKSMGLDELGPFDAQQKIIEYQLFTKLDYPLINMSLQDFAHETASESPAPGGGSISAYVGSLGMALGGMVANLSAHKRGWDKRWEEFSDWAEKAKVIKDELLLLVDEDTKAFTRIMDAVRMPKVTDQEKSVRAKAMEKATKEAIAAPFQVMQTSMKAFPILEAMANSGNPNSVSDAGVGALCIRAAIHGAYLNVKINAPGLTDLDYAQKILSDSEALLDEADENEKRILGVVLNVIDKTQ